MKKIEVILLFMAIFGHIFFFGYYILAGKVYGGASVDNSYVFFTILMSILPTILFIKYLFSNTSKRSIVPIILSISIFLIILLVEAGFNYRNMLIRLFLAYSIPSALIGVLISKYNMGGYFAKWLEPLMLFLTLIGLRSTLWILAVSYTEIDEEGIGAQSLSYYCGFAFAINLFFLLFGNEIKERFKYTRAIIYKYISVALLIVQVVVSISSGGRGGFVLVVVSAGTLIILRILKLSGNVIRTLFVFFLMLVATALTIRYMPDNISEAVSIGSERTLSYISEEGIDMGETSTRDEVYSDAINDIRLRPIGGYGLLMKGSSFEGDRPHNIFLEVMLQGGILYLFLFLIILYCLLRKIRLLIRSGQGLFIIPVALYPAVMLFFSGSYVTTGLFWFVITYIMCYEENKHPEQPGESIIGQKYLE